MVSLALGSSSIHLADAQYRPTIAASRHEPATTPDPSLRPGDFKFELLSLDLKPDPRRGLDSKHIFLAGSADTVLFSEIAEVLDATRSSGRPESTMDEASAEG